MAKKVFSGKKKKSKAAASPLMADEPKSSSSSSSSSSRLNRDNEREARKKEREERRKKRENRRDGAKGSSSKSSKKKSTPKLSQADQDAVDSQLGCWYKTKHFLVKMVHILDAIIGLTFVVYGSLINKFENPAKEAVITTLTFGSTLLFTSMMGVIGFCSKMCSRCGLVFSGYTAPFIAFFYLLVIVILLSSPDLVSDYLMKYKDVLYLNDAEILTLKQILPFFYIVLASLAAIEIIRFVVLGDLRKTLVRYDAASERIFDSMLSSKRSDRSSPKRSSSKRSGSKRSGSSRSGSNRTNLTKPLIGDEEEGIAESDDY